MKRFLLFTLISVISIAFSSCNKNAYDFSRLDGLDADGSWGVPLVNADFTIEDILNMAEGLSFIQTGDDGTLELTYQLEQDSLISSDVVLNIIKDKVFTQSRSLSIPISRFPSIPNISFDLIKDTTAIDLPTDQAILEYAEIKSGHFLFTVDHDIPIDFTIEISSSQLKDANGNDFVFTKDISAHENNSISLDIAGYEIQPLATNKLQFYIHIHATSTGQAVSANPSVHYSFRVENIALRELRGKVTSFDVDLDETMDIDLGFLAQKLGGAITIYDPQVKCEVMNSFPVGGKITLTDASLRAPGLPASPLLSSSPAVIELPGNTQQYENVSLPIASSLYVSTKMNQAHISGNAVLNPDGMSAPTITLKENQFINFRMSFVLPLKVKIDDVTFKDTIDFGGVDIPDISGISNMLLRLAFENGLPFDMNLQAYFYDSATHSIKDSLFATPMNMIGCYTGTPMPSEVYVAKDDMTQIRRMLSCDKIILKAGINTNDRQIAVRNSQSLRIRLGAKFDVDLGILADQLLTE